MINYSIIIPHHNCPKLLERLIASIPARDDIQIIVVDDASDPEIVDFSKYKFDPTKRIDFYQIPKEESKWAGHARNVGLEHAEGKWLLFADSDDFYCENAFDVLDKYTESDFDVVYYNCKSVDSETFLPSDRTNLYSKKVFEYIANPSSDKLFFFRYKQHMPWYKMVKKQLVEKDKLRYEEVIKGNDTLFSHLVGHFANKVIVIPDFIYTCTYRKDSMTFSKRSWQSLIHEYQAHYKEYAFYDYIGAKEWKKNKTFFSLIFLSRVLRQGKTLKDIAISFYKIIFQNKKLHYDDKKYISVITEIEKTNKITTN